MTFLSYTYVNLIVKQFKFFYKIGKRMLQLFSRHQMKSIFSDKSSVYHTECYFRYEIWSQNFYTPINFSVMYWQKHSLIYFSVVSSRLYLFTILFIFLDTSSSLIINYVTWKMQNPIKQKECLSNWQIILCPDQLHEFNF